MKRLKKLTALVATTLLTASLFVGCGSSNVGENGTINFFNVGDYIDEALIRKFEKETGIKVNYSTYDTNEIMYQNADTDKLNDFIFKQFDISQTEQEYIKAHIYG